MSILLKKIQSGQKFGFTTFVVISVVSDSLFVEIIIILKTQQLASYLTLFTHLTHRLTPKYKPHKNRANPVWTG